MPRVHGEIMYDGKDGHVHSDICPPECSSDNLDDMEYRKFLHTCLDEWLEKSKGTGYFYLKNEQCRMP